MYEYKATVRRWVDGDTVDVDIDLGFGLVYSNQRIRLYGINAFETRTRDLEEKRRGLDAKSFVEDMAPVGSEIILKTYKGDKYGRMLGEVFVDGKNLNTLLTVEGHATRYEL